MAKITFRTAGSLIIIVRNTKIKSLIGGGGGSLLINKLHIRKCFLEASMRPPSYIQNFYNSRPNMVKEHRYKSIPCHFTMPQQMLCKSLKEVYNPMMACENVFMTFLEVS